MGGSFLKRSLSLLLILSVAQQAVTQDYSTVHPSPNIGWSMLGIKQQNNLYLGATTLNIPIFNLNVGSINVPITLNYVTKSVNVDQLPSWVGSGWNLQAGGQITRVVNGKPDEYRDLKRRTTIVQFFPSPSSSSTVMLLSDNDFGYIANNQYLNNSNWASSGYLQNTLATLPYIESHMHETTIYTDQPPYINNFITPFPDYTYHRDFQPDEFIFHIGTVSGKFYLNHENNWICETNQGNFTVDPPSIATEVTKGNRKIARMIYQFVLTGPDGTRYTFGGEENNKLGNIEFWRGPMWTATGGTSINGFDTYFNQYVNVCPAAWHLTRIESADGKSVYFQYKTGGFQVNYSDAPQGAGGDNSLLRKFPGSIFQSLAEPIYLTKITGSNGMSVEINSENSTQLSTNQRIDNLSPYSSFMAGSELAPTLENSTNNLLKVTSIWVKYGSTLRKNFEFDYFENQNQRLKLKSLREAAISEGSGDLIYSFEYNAGQLPAYGSGLVDHFGYYNNNRFFSDNTTTNYNISKSAFKNDYYNSREPNFTYAVYETLSKVYFPTGGYREYVYQPHDYSAKIGQWPFNTTALGSNLNTGGIRLYKMIDYTSTGNKASEVEYIYKNELAGTQSSGIFSIPTPKYTDDLSDGSYTFSTRSYIPFDRAVSHITYSTVFEKFADGSYKKNVYWNFENGANDEGPVFETSPMVYDDGQAFSRHEYKRGLLKSTFDYDNSGTLVRSNEFEYQHQFDDYSRFIRYVRVNHLNSSSTGYKSAAFKTFYFPNQVRATTETIKSPYGDIITRHDISYDANNLQLQISSKNSKNETIKINFKYPYHFATSDPLAVYTRMKNKGIRNVVIEETKVITKNSVDYLFGGEVNEYGLFNGSMLLLKNKYGFRSDQLQAVSGITATQYNASTSSLVPDSRYLPVGNFHYNIGGNVQQQTSYNMPKTGFIWGYNNEYIVAKVVNAENSATLTEFFYEGFEELLSTPPSDPYAGKNYNQGDFTVPFTKPNGKSYKVNYHFLEDGKWKNMTRDFSNNMTLTDGIAIDEVRVYPADAFMTTYTYIPLAGISSETDPNGKTYYFYYDGLNRARMVKDQDGNIIKSFEYGTKQTINP